MGTQRREQLDHDSLLAGPQTRHKLTLPRRVPDEQAFEDFAASGAEPPNAQTLAIRQAM